MIAMGHAVYILRHYLSKDVLYHQGTLPCRTNAAPGTKDSSSTEYVCFLQWILPGPESSSSWSTENNLSSASIVLAPVTLLFYN